MGRNNRSRRTRNSSALRSPSTLSSSRFTSVLGARGGAVQAAGGSVDTARGYDEAALAYAGHLIDPYADIAQQYRQAGHRFPDPYAAKAVEVAQQAARFMTQHGGQNYGRDVYSAASVAGRHVTQWGAVADATRGEFEPWDARQQAGYLESGYRDAGMVSAMDGAEINRRDSGFLTESMTVTVNPERPYLMLDCPDGSVDVLLVAGAEGGAETARRFILGGGFTASFCLDAFNTVTVRPMARQAGSPSVINYAWLVDGMQAGDQSLYMPRMITAADLDALHDVPEGAFAIKVTYTDVTWLWHNPIFGAGADITGVTAGVDWNPVAGSRFFPSSAGILPEVNQPVIWRLRPI